MTLPIDALNGLIETLRAHPGYAVAGAAALVVAYRLLQRKSRLQREADERLSALRREKADRYRGR